MPRVLVTGAAGVLGQAIIPLLEVEEDIQLRLTDIVPLDTPHEFISADLSRWEAVEPVCDGIDQVLHVAAIHPWKDYRPEQYIACNIQGTYNVLRAAAAAGVQRVIYTSSIAAMGYAVADPCDLPFDETKPCHPTENVYGISKHVGEQWCQFFQREAGLDYVALRPGTFIPRDENDPGFGLGLLGAWLHRDDVAQAHLQALHSDLANESVIIAASTPFTRDEGQELVDDARAVILRHFPDAAKLEERGIKLPASLTRTYGVSKARDRLGYAPAWTFERWLAEALAK